ncbi:MAG: DUF5677 domain-containing protein [Candidatus Shapirobacteria bacterium]
MKNSIKLLNLNKELRYLAYSLIQPEKIKIRTYKDGVACYMISKAYKTQGVVLDLIQKGFSEDADMLIRTLFDCALIISACINDESDETTMKFINFDDSIRTKMFKQLNNQNLFTDYFTERKKSPKLGDESIEEIENRAQKWIEIYGKDFKNHWHSGKSTGEVAELVDLKKYYETAWALQTHLVHSLPRCLNLYIKDDGKELIIDVEPKIEDSAISLVSLFNIFYIVVSKFSSHFELKKESVLSDLATRYTRIVNTN